MPEVLENHSSLMQIYEEFDMSPAKDFHNEYLAKMYLVLDRILAGSQLVVKIDTFRYLDGELINVFGDFKTAVDLENFVAGMKRFGAPKKFIQKKIDEYAGMGLASAVYAPDLFVTTRAERRNEFGVPLLVMEILSYKSRDHDLYFKPFFYETIGVREYFVGEASIEYGKIVKAYRLVRGRFQVIPRHKNQYASTVLGAALPAVVALE